MESLWLGYSLQNLQKIQSSRENCSLAGWGKCNFLILFAVIKINTQIIKCLTAFIKLKSVTILPFITSHFCEYVLHVGKRSGYNFRHSITFQDLGMPETDQQKQLQQTVCSSHLCNDKLCIFGTAELQLVSNVRKRYSGVREVDHANSGLDYIMTQTHDQSVRSLGWELVRVRHQRLTEVVQVASANSCS